MDVREKLVEIIQNSVGGCARHWAEVIADGLIAHGVTVQKHRKKVTCEFEPCPFCENTNITGATHKPVGSAEFYEVLCVECGARIRRSSKRKAVAAWNRRVDNG